MSRTSRPVAALSLAAVAALTLAGCASSSSSTGEETAAGSEGFPLTIESALGDAVIESQPERIATWGWGATDAVLALGIVPVAVPSDTYSGGEDLLAPWITEKLDELGGEPPVILDNSTYELSVEELLATDPDVLLAPYSGLTQDEFDAVTAAGIPVVAYPDAPWTTPWRDAVELVGEALGREEETADVLDGLDALVADAAAAHPEFADTSVAIVTESAGTYYAYLPSDPRVELLENLGFTTPDSVTAFDTGESTFSVTLSPENLDQLDADVIVLFAESEDALQTTLASETTRLIPAVQSGAVAPLVGPEEVSSISPTPLTLPWGLESLVGKLATATATAQS